MIRKKKMDLKIIKQKRILKIVKMKTLRKRKRKKRIMRLSQKLKKFLIPSQSQTFKKTIQVVFYYRTKPNKKSESECRNTTEEMKTK
jgi:hypothetical protein